MEVKDVIWHDRDDYPEEYKPIIIVDSDGDEIGNHYWNGSYYYEEFEDNDGWCIGCPSDWNIVKWRYAD